MKAVESNVIDTVKVAYVKSGSGDIRVLLEKLIEFYDTHRHIVTLNIQFNGTDAAQVFFSEHG